MALIPLTFSFPRAVVLGLLNGKASTKDGDKEIYRMLAARLDGVANDVIQLRLDEIRALFVNLAPP